MFYVPTGDWPPIGNIVVKCFINRRNRSRNLVHLKIPVVLQCISYLIRFRAFCAAENANNYIIPLKGWRSETVSTFVCCWLRANANQVTQPRLSMKYGVDHLKLIIYVIEMLTEQSYIYKIWGCICKVQTNGFWVFVYVIYGVIPWHLSASLTSTIIKGTCCLVSRVGDICRLVLVVYKKPIMLTGTYFCVLTLHCY